MLRKIEHIGAYVITDWKKPVNPSGPNPYHPLCTAILDYPPNDYIYTEEPLHIDKDYSFLLDDLNTPWSEFRNFQEHLLNFRELCRQQNIADQDFYRFIKTRNINEQLMTPPDRLCYINTIPYCLAPNNWYCEIEDWITLFSPFGGNGRYFDVEKKLGGALEILKCLFSMPNFKGVLTHLKQTILSLVGVFGAEFLDKFFYVPIGMPEIKGIENKKFDNKITFFFQGCSTKHSQVHFQFRGGLYLLEAFDRLVKVYPNKNFELVVIYDENGLSYVSPYYLNILKNNPKIRYINRFVSDQELHEELLSADVFLVPAFRVHSASTTQALMYGLPVIASDGWGFDEYIIDGFNGFLSKGCTSSWVDERGIFRENYDLNYSQHKDSPLVDSLVKNMSYFIEDPQQLKVMSKNALSYARENFSIPSRNEILKYLLDGFYV